MFVWGGADLKRSAGARCDERRLYVTTRTPPCFRVRASEFGVEPLEGPDRWARRPVRENAGLCGSRPTIPHEGIDWESHRSVEASVWGRVFLWVVRSFSSAAGKSGCTRGRVTGAEVILTALAGFCLARCDGSCLLPVTTTGTTNPARWPKLCSEAEISKVDFELKQNINFC